MARPGTTQGVRGPLLRFHTFFSAHTTDYTLKSSWTVFGWFFGQMLRSISGISPGGIAIPSSFYGWIFSCENEWNKSWNLIFFLIHFVYFFQGFWFFIFKNKHNKRINGKIYSALTCSQVGTSSYTELQENYSGVWKKVFPSPFFSRKQW